MDIDSASPIALYLQIANHFRDLVKNNHLSSGDRLPAEFELAERYDVSRGTVRQAMRVLENEGLIERVPGKGTFIRQKLDVSAPLIGVILPTMRDQFAMDILTGIEQTAKKRAYQIVFAQTQEQIEQEATDIERMREQGVAGFLLFPISDMSRDPLVEQLIRENFPLVLMDRYFSGLEIDIVTSDNVGGGHMATEHLIKLGHERIGFVTSSSTVTSSIHDRFQGYLQALQEHGLVYKEAIDFCLMDDLEDFLMSSHRPSAIFATNDFTAISLLQAAAKHSIQIPEDLALVSFDNIKQAAHLRVPLTTVAQSGRRIGEVACKVLMEQMSGIRRPPQHELLPVYLVVRQSCGTKLERRCLEFKEN